MGGAVPCVFPCTAFETKTDKPFTNSKVSSYTICTGDNLRDQNSGNHFKLRGGGRFVKFAIY